MKRYRIIDEHGVIVQHMEADSMCELLDLLKEQITEWLTKAYPEMGTERDPGVAVERFRRQHGRLPGKED